MLRIEEDNIAPDQMIVDPQLIHESSAMLVHVHESVRERVAQALPGQIRPEGSFEFWEFVAERRGDRLHMPERGSRLLSHPDAIPGVGGTSEGVEGGPRQESAF